MNRDQQYESQYEGAEKDLGPGDVIETVFRHKKKALFFSTTVVALAALVILFAPRSYRSESRLFLQVGRESVRLDPTATQGKTIGIQQAGRDSEVATAMEVLSSRAILERTVERLTPEVVLGEASGVGVKANPIADAALKPLQMLSAAVKSIDPISKREEAVIVLERNLEVDAEHESTVIALTYDAKSAKLAQLVLTTVVDVYRDEHVRLHQTQGSRPFFAQQRDELEHQLSAAEHALREAKNRMGVGSIDSRRTTLEDRLATLEKSRNGVIQSISGSEARITALKGHIESMPERMHTSTRVMPNTGADALRSQLYSLQVELMNLEAKYNAEHPLVVSARDQVEEARRMLAGEDDSREETLDTINPNQRALLLELAQAETSLAGSQATLAQLEDQRATALVDLRKLNDFEVEIKDLERDALIARNNFLSYSKDFEEARVDEELDRQKIMNVAVAQQATLAEKPVSPSKLLVAALSLLLATAGSMALILAAEKFDSRVHGEERLEHLLRLPVLATVPDGRAYASAAR